jgi:hypothetical protein
VSGLHVSIGGGAELDAPATRQDIQDLSDSLENVPRTPVHPSEPAFWQKRTQNGVAVTGQPLVLYMGSPNIGRQWNLRNIVVVGPDAITPVAGTSVALYIGEISSVAVGGTPPVGDLFLPGAQGGSAVTVPANFQPGSKGAMIVNPDDLYVVVFGGANGQSFTSTCWFWDEAISFIDPFV